MGWGSGGDSGDNIVSGIDRSRTAGALLVMKPEAGVGWKCNKNSNNIESQKP